MIVIIDNYDSFTYNLVQYFGELITEMNLHEEIKVFRNDRTDITEIESLNPNYLAISPGPGTPKESGLSRDLIQRFSGRIPILGVCLGHQCIGEVFGGNIIRAPYPVHGKVAQINHNGENLFKNIEKPFTAVRYHSLVIEKESLPEILEITATCQVNEETELIMGVRHRKHHTYGVQFHPESIFTNSGKRLLANFLKIKTA